MRYLLDTNILSNITKPEPSVALMTWMADQTDEDLYIASLTVAEIHKGILEKPAGKKRTSLETWFAGDDGPQRLFANRILPFDETAALIWGRLMAEGKASGRSRSGLDTIIAATAQANGCIVVTVNEKEFHAIEIINPLRTGDG
jgi:predicted nucleic acid-binding protein